MSISSQIFASVRQGARALFASGGVQTLQQNQGGDLLTSFVLPERSELVRLGNSYGAQIKEANAFTLLITIPTTLAGLALQNGEKSGGKSYLIDRCWYKNVTTTAAANYVSLLGQVIIPGTALVADSANKTIQSLSGKATYGGLAQIALASTAVGALADKWFVLGTTGSQPTSTSIAAGIEAFVYGRYLVPPQGTFALNAQEAVSGGTGILGIEWHEVQCDLG